MKRQVCNHRRGLTLLELVIASAMLATIMTVVAVVLRTGRQAWEAHESDYVRLEALHGTVRHIVRQVRQAKEVTQISAANDSSGRLGLRLNDGTELVWDHAGSTVNCGVTTADQLLATNITTFRFVGYRADGTTATTVPEDIQNLMIEASTTLPNRDVGGTKTIQSWAWLRTW
jgi:prepilin-type N-terminal cleavage/methylation domain-containing protein